MSRLVSCFRSEGNTLSIIDDLLVEARQRIESDESWRTYPGTEDLIDAPVGQFMVHGVDVIIERIADTETALVVLSELMHSWPVPFGHRSVIDSVDVTEWPGLVAVYAAQCFYELFDHEEHNEGYAFSCTYCR